MHLCLTWIRENSKSAHMNTTSEYFLQAKSKLLAFAWQENEGGLDARDMESDWYISTRYHWLKWMSEISLHDNCRLVKFLQLQIFLLSCPFPGCVISFLQESKLISHQEWYPSTLPEGTDSVLEDTRVILVRSWEGRSGKLLIIHQTEIRRSRDYSDCASGKK